MKEYLKQIEEAKELGLGTYTYQNGDWEYRDIDGYYHLFRNGEELLPKVKKVYIQSHPNGDWDYKDTDGYHHLIRDGKELLPKIKKIYIDSYSGGAWCYANTNGEYHIAKGDDNE